MDTSYYTEHKINIQPKGRFSSINMLVIDVDGTMTDGGIYYDENGNELKKFNTRDAAGFFAAKVCGIKTMILTGRECAATMRRMKELQVDYIVQDVKDKEKFLKNYICENNMNFTNVGYLGDDLNDYKAMQICGFIGCPADACAEIKELSTYISRNNGGEGAVRDIIAFLLKEREQWDYAIQNIYNIGI